MLIRKTVDRIKREFPDPLQYDAKLCTLLLQVYGELGDLKQLAALMQDMRRLNIPIDIHVYNTLINIFISYNDRNNVLRILEEMRKSNIEPNSVTFAALLKYFAEQGASSYNSIIITETNSAQVTLTRRSVSRYWPPNKSCHSTPFCPSCWSISRALVDQAPPSDCCASCIKTN